MEKDRFLKIIDLLEYHLKYYHGLCLCLGILETHDFISSREKQHFSILFNKEFPSIWYDIEGNESPVVGLYRFPNDQSRIEFLNMLRDDADYHI
jgi:hypothetical protein